MHKFNSSEIDFQNFPGEVFTEPLSPFFLGSSFSVWTSSSINSSNIRSTEVMLYENCKNVWIMRIAQSIDPLNENKII